MKKLFLLLVILLSTVSIFADSYSVKILNADSLTADGSLIVIKGNIVLEIKTDGSEDESRKLTAEKVVVNTETKEITASGSVSLSGGSVRDYTGDSLIFNWDTLDLTLFNGESSIEKTNSENKKITFYLDGETVSYGGDGGPVIMDGVILSTKDEGPYWSIEAQNIAILESDFVFKNATIKLGRVPVLWIPYFYYPNTRLAFNPAVGISGTKGLFLNTTYEVYGKYPTLWNTPSSSSSSSSSTSDSAAALSALSLLSESDSSMVRDGLIYRKSDSSSSSKNKDYFVFMADAYKNYGVALGVDTHNTLLDSSLVLDAKGVLAYKADPIYSYYGKMRYAADLSASYTKGNTTLSLSFPVLSDPEVKHDFYNRNTTFQLDTLLGQAATVPTTYKSNLTTYTWEASLKTSFKALDQSFTLTTLEAARTFKWNSTEHIYEESNTVLPELDATLSGTVFSFKKDTEKTKQVTYSNDLANSFLTEYRELEEEEEGEEEEKSFNTYSAKDPGEKTEKDSYGVSMDYNFRTYLKDELKEEDSYYFKFNGTVNLKANSPLDIISVTETLTPTYVYTMDESKTNPESKDLKILSNLTINSPVIGLKYNQQINLYRYKLSENVITDYPMKWEKDCFKAHSVEFSKTLGSFTFSLNQQLKPLDLILTPTITFTKGVYTIKTSSQLYLEDDQLFEKGKTTLTVNQKDETYDFKVTNTYDFSKDGWDGNTFEQTLSWSFLNKSLKLTEKLVLEKDFQFKTLSLGVSYNKNYINMSFKNTSFDPDELAVHLDYTLTPIYWWYNRIGFSTSVAATYKKNFNNRYGSSLVFDFSLDFAISEFVDLKIKSTSTNTSFYRYYDDEGDFSLNLMFDDLLRSFDFFGNGRKSTGFNLSKFSLQFVHYMHDWTLNLEASASIATKNSERYWNPEVTVYIKWNAIPELKRQNTLKNSVWEY